MTRTLLIPSLLDDHFPLLRHAFAAPGWEPVLLAEEEEDPARLAELGLKYFHNELCYPVFLVAGQVLSALGGRKYDPDRCAVLIGQAGDECRGSCFIRLLRKVLDRAGYPGTAVVSLNVRDIDRDVGLPISFSMVRRALAAAVWGDSLAIARNAVRPYEAVPGAAVSLWARWVETLGEDLRQDRNLSRRGMLRRCRELAVDFRALETVDRPAQRVAVVGEIYTKNCHLGNWDLMDYLAAEPCQVGVGGLTWQALYYMDSHALKGPLLQRAFYRGVQWYAGGIQRDMLNVLREMGFETLPPFGELKENARGLAPLRITVADGWMIAAEAAAWAKLGYRKILCVQPFACLPGHIFGKGQYAKLQRALPDVCLVSVDYDASTGEGTVQTRIRMLLDEEL